MKTLKQFLALLLALTMLLALALPAEAVEKETSPIKKAIAQVKGSNKIAYFGAGYAYPFASVYGATLVKGSSMLLRFRKNPDMRCPDDALFCLAILRGDITELDENEEPEIVEERVIPLAEFSTYDKNFPTARACAINWTADARYPVGDYTVMCFTMDPDGFIDDKQPIYFSSLHVVSSEIPLTDFELYSTLYEEFISEDQITFARGADVYLMPVPTPLKTTTARNKISVKSSNILAVDAAIEDDYILLHGVANCVPATITISCGDVTKTIEVMFGNIASPSATQGKHTLCPGETDLIACEPAYSLHTHFFRSSNPDVVTTTGNLVTAVGPGTADVTLKVGFETVTLHYTVNPHDLPEDAPIPRPAPTATKPAYQTGKCAICGEENAVNVLQPAVFSDTAPNSWYSDHVDYVYEHNIFTGITPTEFKPNQSLTRGQMATVLYRIAGSPEVTSECPFTDVAPGKYYYNAVLWAAENGVVTGYPDATFRPNNQITREQIAAILYRYAQLSGTPADGNPALLSRFPDDFEVSTYAKPALAWALQEKLITGVNSYNITTISPKANATRAQVATILSRYLNPAPEE